MKNELKNWRCEAIIDAGFPSRHLCGRKAKYIWQYPRGRKQYLCGIHARNLRDAPELLNVPNAKGRGSRNVEE